MSSCNSMKAGEIYACSTCGVEIEVKKTCDCDHDANCKPISVGVCCDFKCCSQPMNLK